MVQVSTRITSGMLRHDYGSACQTLRLLAAHGGVLAVVGMPIWIPAFGSTQ